MFNLPGDSARQRFQESFLRIEAAFDKALAHRLGVNLEAIAKQAAKAYEQGGLGAALAIISRFEEPIRTYLLAYLAQTHRHFAKEALNALDPALGRSENLTRAAQRYVRTYGAAKVQNICEGSRQAIREVVVQALEEGLDVPDIQRRIVERTGGGIARRRARAIAQTETHAAACAGSQAAVASLNRPYRKEWIAALQPGRTRPWHAAVHGQIVDGDAPFLVDGERLQYPGDPAGRARNVINCRCVNAYLM